MKRIIECNDTAGFETMLGERITLFCVNYIYTGTLAGVNESFVELTDAAIVYETGELGSKEWKDAQSLPYTWQVQIAAVESWGKLKC